MAKAKTKKKLGPARKAALKAKTTKEQALEVLGGVLARTSLSLRECTVLRQCCDARIAQIQKPRELGQGVAANAAMVAEVTALFEKLTGHPLNTEE